MTTALQISILCHWLIMIFAYYMYHIVHITLGVSPSVALKEIVKEF